MAELKIKRFKLKENADVSSVPLREHMTYVHKDAVRGFFKTLKGSVSLNVAFPQDLPEWNDFDFVLVFDEDFCQPYTPFYNFLNGDTKPFPFLAEVVKAYNEVMESLPYLEEIE